MWLSPSLRRHGPWLSKRGCCLRPCLRGCCLRPDATGCSGWLRIIPCVNVCRPRWPVRWPCLHGCWLKLCVQVCCPSCCLRSLEPCLRGCFVRSKAGGLLYWGRIPYTDKGRPRLRLRLCCPWQGPSGGLSMQWPCLRECTAKPGLRVSRLRPLVRGPGAVSPPDRIGMGLL